MILVWEQGNLGIRVICSYTSLALLLFPFFAREREGERERERERERREESERAREVERERERWGYSRYSTFTRTENDSCFLSK